MYAYYVKNESFKQVRIYCDDQWEAMNLANLLNNTYDTGDFYWIELDVE